MNTALIRSRLRWLLLFFVLLLALAGGKLFYVQIFRGSYYSALADRQYEQPASPVFDRGSIFFKNKDGELAAAATVVGGFRLILNTKLLQNPGGLYENLAVIWPALDAENFFARAARPNDPYEVIAEHLDKAAAKKATALKWPGLSVERERWRVYPAGRMAAHTLGFLGYRGDELAGRYGLESQYEEVLKRSAAPTFLSYIIDAFSHFGRSLLGTAENTGSGDLVLTIEPTVQNTLEKELTDVETRYQAEGAAGVIIDPMTGAILALAAHPDFDPGGTKGDLQVLANPLVENVFEFGSIVKPLTMAAGLDAGVVTPETTYNDQGTLTLNGRTIGNYDGKARGVVPMQQVLSQSLNTGAVYVEQALGEKRFRQYFQDYGLGQKTGIDLPNETAGLISNLDKGQAIDFATAAYGQGVAFTALGVTRALSSLANGGLLVKPHVVSQINYQNGAEPLVTKPVVSQRVLRAETSGAITNMLVKVVDEALAGGKLKMVHYKIAAKTGTAQIPSPEGGYYPDRYLHSFFGYFPASQPRFLVFLYLTYPKNVQYASETLTETFGRLTKFLINYYNVPPDR
jgi:cell division protein FtsI/penicillin-binding protein 2